MADPNLAATLTTTSFRRPVLEDNVVNAKAGCLYPNNARMLAEARTKGFSNALVADIMGNVAETATANIFIVKDGEVFTPIPNGTFLAGITRNRHISNLKADGYKVHEKVIPIIRMGLSLKEQENFIGIGQNLVKKFLTRKICWQPC